MYVHKTVTFFIFRVNLCWHRPPVFVSLRWTRGNSNRQTSLCGSVLKHKNYYHLNLYTYVYNYTTNLWVWFKSTFVYNQLVNFLIWFKHHISRSKLLQQPYKDTTFMRLAPLHHREDSTIFSMCILGVIKWYDEHRGSSWSAVAATELQLHLNAVIFYK